MISCIVWLFVLQLVFGYSMFIVKDVGFVIIACIVAKFCETLATLGNSAARYKVK